MFNLVGDRYTLDRRFRVGEGGVVSTVLVLIEQDSGVWPAWTRLSKEVLVFPADMTVVVEPRDDAGAELASGIYLYRLTSPRERRTRKLLLLR